MSVDTAVRTPLITIARPVVAETKKTLLTPPNIDFDDIMIPSKETMETSSVVAPLVTQERPIQDAEHSATVFGSVARLETVSTQNVDANSTKATNSLQQVTIVSTDKSPSVETPAQTTLVPLSQASVN